MVWIFLASDPQSWKVRLRTSRRNSQKLEITKNKTEAVLQSLNSNRIRRHKDALHAVVASVEKAKLKLEEMKISAGEDLTAITTWGDKLEEDISAVDLDMGKVSTILAEMDRKELEKVRKDQLDFERELFEKKLKYTKELETINSSNQAGNHTGEQNTTRAKLPKLSITKFSGTNLDWTRFWGQFSEVPNGRYYEVFLYQGIR